jgi:hypothetical protein
MYQIVKVRCFFNLLALSMYEGFRITLPTTNRVPQGMPESGNF